MQLIRAIWPTVLVGSLMMGTVADAGYDYRCIIDREEVARGEAGPMRELDGSYIGKEFTVGRTSGVIAGVLSNASPTTPQVIDLGSKDNAYKVVQTMRREEGVGVGSYIYALIVYEFVKSNKKPFVYLDNFSVFFGHCEHF